MNRDRFLAILEIYGAEPRRWPEDERAAASAFAEREPALVREALALDSVLDESWAPAPSPAVRSRVLAAAPQPRTSRSRIGWWASGMGFAAAAGVAGVVFGASLSSATSDAVTESVLAEVEAYDEALIDLGGAETSL